MINANQFISLFARFEFQFNFDVKTEQLKKNLSLR